MKKRLRELSHKMNTAVDNETKLKSSETLMRTTNLQLMQEISALKQKLSLYTMPTRAKNDDKRIISSYGELVTGESNLNTVRSNIQNSIFSLRT
jgi:hypothetical protein